MDKRKVKIKGNSSKATQVFYSQIGDSLTMEVGTVNGLLTELPTNCRAVGIRTFDNGTENHEGRGGWKLSDYLSRFGRNDGLDSPFLFPKTVEGNKYYGNVAFWKYIINNPNTTNYEYKGFDLIAKDWLISNPYKYDSNGYRLNPSIGDVMFDPSKPSNQRIITFNGTAWVALGVDDTEFEFNYKKYTQRFSYAFSGGARNPNFVSIMLGTNDLQQRNFNDFDGMLKNLKTMYDSIIAYNPSCKVLICVPPTSGSQDAWSDAVGIGMTKWEFDKKLIKWSSFLYSNYWKIGTSNLYLCNLIGVLTESDFADWLHPVQASRYKIGQWIAGYVQYYR